MVKQRGKNDQEFPVTQVFGLIVLEVHPKVNWFWFIDNTMNPDWLSSGPHRGQIVTASVLNSISHLVYQLMLSKCKKLTSPVFWVVSCLIEPG